MPRMVLPSFGLFFRRDGTGKPDILTALAEAIRSVNRKAAAVRSRSSLP